VGVSVLTTSGAETLTVQAGTGFSVYFNETQPAGCLWMLHAFEIAEVRDKNAVTQAGFEQNSALLDFNFFMIY